MLYIENLSTAPYFNLAVEEYLIKNIEDDIVMLWQNEPSIIVGKNQHVESEINREYVERNKIKVVRRFSGGGAVYHDLGNLNLTFIENRNQADFNKQTQQMQSLLKTIGIDAIADQRQTLTVNGLKISGSAQCIHHNRAMYHATLLYNSDLDVLTTALQSSFNSTVERRYVQSVRSPVTNIEQHMPNPIPIEEFKAIVKDFFLTNNSGSTIYTLSEKDKKAINKLVDEKYATADWNFHKKQLSYV